MAFRKVARLENAFSTEFEEAHAHFVSAPVRPGVQACLIERQNLDGSVSLIDTLIVLPSSVLRVLQTDPVYAAYLDLIGREYLADIRRLSADRQVTRWSAKTPNDAPFTCAAVSAIRQNIFAALEASRLRNGRTGEGPRLSESVADLVHRVSKSTLWHPRHITIGRTAQKWRKAWAILARWDDWEQRKLDWAQRLREHASDIGKNIGRKAQEKDALRKLCKSIGLIRGSLSPAKRLLSPTSLPRRSIRC
ncbi:MAG TPA: hypothetical protein VGW57_07585 [Chthoniobacterales bacterium]|nr:hypothetical protein [Chthoniobacterales bacterium]